MTGCSYQPRCGGCCYRNLSCEDYQILKSQKVKNLLNQELIQKDYIWCEPLFLPDGTRRRAAMAFCCRKGVLCMGFNENRSRNIIDCPQCPMLTKQINFILPNLKVLLQQLCGVEIQRKVKKGQFKTSRMSEGDVLILEADNGLDIVLETSENLVLEHRELIFAFVQNQDNLIRFSWRQSGASESEPVVEKIKPVIKISGIDVHIASGTFLQASKAGEEWLTKLLLEYTGTTKGNAADLFCGIGTFSYPLAKNDFKILAADMSQPLLAGFQSTVNQHMLHQIEITKRNLFKYPLAADELKKFNLVVLDPPRAGAQAQVKELADIEFADKPEKIIYISCNPHSFVRDANILINGSYKLVKVTMVDQFVYSNHSELAALFTK